MTTPPLTPKEAVAWLQREYHWTVSERYLTRLAAHRPELGFCFAGRWGLFPHALAKLLAEGGVRRRRRGEPAP